VQLAEADAFRPSLRLARREALWAIKALRDEPLPLFAAASDREARTVPEFCEPAVMLRPMTAGSEVVEDYGHVGPTLCSQPVSFLRGDLRRQRVVTCADAMQARDGRWLLTAGLVLRLCHVIENRAQHRRNPEQQSRRGDDFAPRLHGRCPEDSVRSC
jgi:error-prone DNA polymerase